MRWPSGDKYAMPAPALIGELVVASVTTGDHQLIRHVGVLRYFSYRPGVEFTFSMDGVPHLITVSLRTNTFTIDTKDE